MNMSSPVQLHVSIILVLVATVFLVGCGSKDDEATDSSEAQSIADESAGGSDLVSGTVVPSTTGSGTTQPLIAPEGTGPDGGSDTLRWWCGVTGGGGPIGNGPVNPDADIVDGMADGTLRDDCDQFTEWHYEHGPDGGGGGGGGGDGGGGGGGGGSGGGTGGSQFDGSTCSANPHPDGIHDFGGQVFGNPFDECISAAYGQMWPGIIESRGVESMSACLSGALSQNAARACNSCVREHQCSDGQEFCDRLARQLCQDRIDNTRRNQRP